MVQPRLVTFICNKCKKWLAKALPRSTVHCPQCHAWTGVAFNNKRKN